MKFRKAAGAIPALDILCWVLEILPVPLFFHRQQDMGRMPMPRNGFHAAGSHRRNVFCAT